MFRRVKKTVRIELTDDRDLERYDGIINDPLTTVLREIHEQRTETSSTDDGEGGGSSTTLKFPLLILTYETLELA